MNREILFRGQIDTEEWIYGDLLHSIEGLMYIQDIINGIGEEKYRAPILVKPETVGQLIHQYKDLKIFEGDRIEFCNRNDVYYNEWENPQECIVGKFGLIEGNFGDFELWYINFAIDQDWEFRIIGNKHEVKP